MCLTGSYMDGYMLCIEEDYALQLMQTRELEYRNLGNPFEEVPCPLCGGDKHTVLVVHEVFGEVSQCHTCSTPYASKRFTRDAYEILCRFYVPTHISDPDIYKKVGAGRIKNANMIIDTVESYVPRGKMLDVGASVCDNLVYARCRGWEVRASDLSMMLQRWATDILGIEMHRGYVDEMELEDEEFDAIIMKHVIEHFHDPIADLKILHKALKEHGILYIETPEHAKDLEYFVTNHMLPYHLVNFTRDTLTKLLEQTGFVIEKYESQPNEDSADAMLVVARKGESAQ